VSLPLIGITAPQVPPVVQRMTNGVKNLGSSPFEDDPYRQFKEEPSACRQQEKRSESRRWLRPYQWLLVTFRCTRGGIRKYNQERKPSVKQDLTIPSFCDSWPRNTETYNKAEPTIS